MVDQTILIVTQSSSSMGDSRLQGNRTITELASKYGRSWAQTMIRWHLDSSLSVMLVSVTPERIRQNFDGFGFLIATEDDSRINKLHPNRGSRAHPEEVCRWRLKACDADGLGSVN